MGLDVFIISDDDIKKQKEFHEKNIEYYIFSDKDNGSTGYLRKPYYLPDDFDNTNEEELYIDFLKETPKALDYIINWIYRDADRFKKFLWETKDLNLDTKMDADLTINALNQVKSAIIKHSEVNHESYYEYTDKATIELIDFLIYGVELQRAGKHPKVVLV